MSLDCSCNYDNGDFDEYYWPPSNYGVYRHWTSRLCCCRGCTNRIGYLEVVGVVGRSRPGSEFEVLNNIASEDPDAVSLPDRYMCERCTDLFFSFDDLGFNCVSPFENMVELASEYHALYQEKRETD